MCTDITFCWTKQLFNITFIGPKAFGGRHLFVRVLHSVGPENYLTVS